MATGREHLQRLIARAMEMESWSDAQLQVVREQLGMIDRAMPSSGDFVCQHCAQRLEITVRVVTRDGGNAHCSRNGGRHVPKAVQ